MAAVAFAILFCGVLDGHLAAAAPAAILAFVLSVMIPVPFDEVGGRLAGWALAVDVRRSRPRCCCGRAAARPAAGARGGRLPRARGLRGARRTEAATRADARRRHRAARASFSATSYRPSGVDRPDRRAGALVTDRLSSTAARAGTAHEGERDLDPCRARAARLGGGAAARVRAALLETRHDRAGRRARPPPARWSARAPRSPRRSQARPSRSPPTRATGSGSTGCWTRPSTCASSPSSPAPGRAGTRSAPAGSRRPTTASPSRSTSAGWRRSPRPAASPPRTRACARCGCATARAVRSRSRPPC